MGLNRPPSAARNPVPAGGTGSRRPGAAIVRAVSVTAVVTVCAMWAAPVGAAVKHASSITVSAKPTTAYVGTAVKLSATVRSTGRTPSGTVTFWSGTRKLCTGHLSKASTSCPAGFRTASTKTVVGKYSGDATHQASSGTAMVKILNKLATSTTIANPDPGSEPAGTAYAFDVTVASARGGAAPTGTVEIAPVPPSPADLGSGYRCTVTLTAASDGTGACTVDPPAGTYGITFFEATYEGDATHAGSESAGEHKLITPDITTTTVGPAAALDAPPVVLIATVVNQAGTDILDDVSNIPDTVAFSVDGALVPGCTAVPLTYTDGANIATCTDPLQGGLGDGMQYALQAAYSGDEYNQPSVGTGTISVGDGG